MSTTSGIGEQMSPSGFSQADAAGAGAARPTDLRSGMDALLNERVRRVLSAIDAFGAKPINPPQAEVMIRGEIGTSFDFSADAVARRLLNDYPHLFEKRNAVEAKERESELRSQGII